MYEGVFTQTSDLSVLKDGKFSIDVSLYRSIYFFFVYNKTCYKADQHFLKFGRSDFIEDL